MCVCMSVCLSLCVYHVFPSSRSTTNTTLNYISSHAKHTHTHKHTTHNTHTHIHTHTHTYTHAPQSNVTFSSLVFLPVVFIFRAEYVGQFVLRSAAIMIVTMMTCVCLFTRKFLAIARPDAGSYIIHHTSHIIHHTSHIMHHTSHNITHTHTSQAAS